jgi:hypothetical protein
MIMGPPNFPRGHSLQETRGGPSRASPDPVQHVNFCQHALRPEPLPDQVGDPQQGLALIHISADAGPVGDA